MTIVEFYDHSPIENMVTCLANQPERIIFLGERKELELQREHFYRFLDEIDNFETVLDFRAISHTSLQSIINVLTDIVEENEDVCFDLTGGGDLCLVAAGIVFERFQDKNIQLHRYNVKTGKVYDCDRDGWVVSGEMPDLTVEQNILLHGGAVITVDQKKSGTACWDLNLDFARDLNEMWKLSRIYTPLWNAQTSMLGDFEEMKECCDDECFLCVDLWDAKNLLSQRGRKLNLEGIIPDLRRLGLIQEYTNDGTYLSLRYKDPQVKQCLIKAGTVLELKTYLTAMQIEEDGAYLFNDGMTGVQLDWDGAVHSDGAVETQNEVDVILMHGLIPIFISCKNGYVDENELYKLNTVAQRFGGAYAKKVLVATTLGKSPAAKEFFLQRAVDMGITVIDGVHEMNDNQFAKKLRALAFD